MKLYFSPKSDFGQLLIITTAVASILQPFGYPTANGAGNAAIAFSYPVAVLAKSMNTQLFTAQYSLLIVERKSDNPPPVPGSPGGSR